jgi:hypothetical protein
VIKDLAQSTNDCVKRTVPVCIIGAGTAGIFLARQLRQHNIDVLILEAGSAIARKQEDIGQKCFHHGLHYRGAEQGRSFGLGGTSVLWGGQMIPLTASDMAARPKVNIPSWPVDYDEVTAYFTLVKKILDLCPDNPLEEKTLLAKYFPAFSQFSPDFELRLSQWLPFEKRNFAKAFSSQLDSDPSLEVWLNAPVMNLEQCPDDPRKITSVHSKSPSGKSLIVDPQILILCAGALESTRLMLAFDESSEGLITKSGAPLGRYFADHLSVTCGRFQAKNWRRYNLETSTIFEKGVMRTPRLEISSQTQDELSLTSAFAHFTFITQGDTGLDIVRDLLRNKQGERRTPGIQPQKLGVIASDISAMAFWRGVYGRLYIPRQAELLLQVDIEQFPNWNSCLKLADERDDLGRKRLITEWQIMPDDIRAIRTVAEKTINAWEQSNLRDTAQLELTLPEMFDNFESLYDVYHPTGTLRMGKKPSDSVVDANLRVWSLDNTYISTTGVFPSAGSANPGLTHLALTARLAKHILIKHF